MYRIACVYEKNHPRMAGKSGGSARVKAGVWRVFDCWHMPTVRPTYCVDGALLITGTKPLKIGTLCNPLRILAERQAATRLCRAVARVAADPVLTHKGV